MGLEMILFTVALYLLDFCSFLLSSGLHEHMNHSLKYEN